MREKIPVGADHAGFELKERLVQELSALGYEAVDVGTHSAASTDYPDYAHVVADQVARGQAKRGCCSAAPGSGCRTRPIVITAFGRRWPGPRRSPS